MDLKAIQSVPGWGWPVNPKADRPVAGDRLAGPVRQDDMAADKRAAIAEQPAPVEDRPAEPEPAPEPVEPPPQRFRAEYRYDEGRSFVELLNDATERVLWTVPARAVVELMDKGTQEDVAGARLNRVA